MPPMSSSSSSPSSTWLVRCAAVALALASILADVAPVAAQQSAAPADSGKGAKKKKAKGDAAGQGSDDGAPRPPGLVWRDSAPVVLTVAADMRRLKRDDGAAPPWRGARLVVDGAPAPIAARLRARGNWRRKHCELPPLRLDVAKSVVRGTALEGLERPKLVLPCRGGEEGDRYVLQEAQLYRVWAALTPPLAHRTRLLRLTIRDSADAAAPSQPRWALLVEEPNALAGRDRAAVIEQKGTAPGDLDPFTDALHGLFQFMIGNTDWSVSALHNVEVMARGGAYYPVPYDFDFSGAVEARYATPAPELKLRTVRQRLFRGYCVPDDALQAAIARMQERRPAIEALYRDEIGRLLPAETVQRTLAYFEEFYRVLDDPGAVRREIVAACRRG